MINTVIVEDNIYMQNHLSSMLAGDESIVKPDRHVIRFIQENSDSPVKSQEEIQLVMEQTTSILRNTYPKLTVRYLDNLIWDYQRHKKNS